MTTDAPGNKLTVVKPVSIAKKSLQLSNDYLMREQINIFLNLPADILTDSSNNFLFFFRKETVPPSLSVFIFTLLSTNPINGSSKDVLVAGGASSITFTLVPFSCSRNTCV